MSAQTWCEKGAAWMSSIYCMWLAKKNNRKNELVTVSRSYK
jgi:hypothetical protein